MSRNMGDKPSSPSSASTTTLAEWRANVQAMKTGLSELKRTPSTQNGNGKGTRRSEEEADWDEDEVDYPYPYEPRSRPRDIWDFLSDDEVDRVEFDFDDSGDGVDYDYDGGEGSGGGYDLRWLAAQCEDIARRKSGLDPSALQGQVLEMLAAAEGYGEEALQSELTDLVGFDDLEFVIALLSHREDILRGLSAAGQEVAAADEVREVEPGLRLMSKKQREDALRRRDREHKAAPLAAAQAKGEEYPHVYRAFAAGNTLSHAGKRFALPAGTERKEFEKYEEYSIPAGKTGTLGLGQKLVPIAEMDGLCRNTFKGYKALNRMQSLVYPVAYKTSENLLICAPTGAVSLLRW